MPDEPRILVPLSAGFEEIEAVTVIDVMRRAGFTVVSAAAEGTAPLRASNGVVIVPDAPLEDALNEEWDLVAVPGGMDNARFLSTHEPLLDVLRRRFERGRLVAAICAAPTVLQAAGITSSIAITSHPVVKDELRTAGEYREDAVVTDGAVITSRGAGTAMDWALHLVERLAGADRRAQVEVQLALRAPPA